MNPLFAIFIGGGLGSLARYGVGVWMTRLFPLSFPFGTLVANILSALLLGIFIGFTAGKPDSENQLRFLVAIGFCGGFSTFSSFSAETFELFRNGMIFHAGINIITNLVICIIMIAVGAWLGRNIF